jgi:hypothetical protein
MRAGQGTAIAVTGAGHGEDCHHGRPFAAAVWSRDSRKPKAE